MQHLDTDRLAALADEAPTEAEAAHLASCVVCRRERDAFVALLALAQREGAAGLMSNAPGDAPLTSWGSISSALESEGLLRSPDAALVVGDITPARKAHTITLARQWRRAAASIALLVGGAALGRVTAPNVAASPASPAASRMAAQTPAPAAASVPNSATPRATQGISDTLPVHGEPNGGARFASQSPNDTLASFASVQEAMRVLTRASRDYQSAAAFLAEHDTATTAGTPQTLRARLAALDEVLPRFREALSEAPQDPVLNQYYLTASDVRESTLRQLGRALPASIKLNAY